MKSSNNGKTEHQLNISCHEMKLQLLGLVTYNWVADQRGPSQGNHQTTQAVAKTIGCSPQTDSKTLLQKTITTQVIEYEGVELVAT